MNPTSESLALPSNRWIVVALVLVGAALRLYPILWGSAFYSQDQFVFHPDEPKIVRYADDFPGSLQTNTDFRYALLVHHFGGLAWWPVKKLAGWDDDGVFVEWSTIRQPMPEGASMVGHWSYERALIFLRLGIVLIFGVGGTLLLLAFARRAGIVEAAPWVAAAAAIQHWPILSSAVVQTDTPSAALIFLSVFVALGIEQRGQFTARESVLAGLAVGAAVAARYTSGVAALSITCVVVAALVRRRIRLGRAVGFLTGAAAASFAAFIAVVPGSIYSFDEFWGSIAYEYTSKRVLPEFDAARVWDSLTRCAPVWILAPTVIGLVLILRRHRSAALAGGVLGLAVYFAVAYKSLPPDFVMPLMPFAALFSGVALQRLAGLGRAGRWVGILYVLGGLLFTAGAVHERYAGDTRYRGDEWIKANIPPGNLGLPRSPRGRVQPSMRAPAGYKYINVYNRPKWIVIPYRRSQQFFNVHEDPNHYPLFPFDAEKRTLGKLVARDFDFLEDVLLGKGRHYRYELVHEIEPSPWRLDNSGDSIRFYRRSW